MCYSNGSFNFVYFVSTLSLVYIGILVSLLIGYFSVPNIKGTKEIITKLHLYSKQLL